MTSLAMLLKEAADRFGENPFLIEPGRTISFNETETVLNRIAAGLRRERIKQGDRVGLIGPGSIDYILTMMATVQLGATICPLSPRFPSAMIKRISSDIGISAIIGDRHNVSVESIRLIELSELDLNAAIEDLPPSDPDQVVSILLTSGSSATPKPVAHSFWSHLRNASGAIERIPFEPGDRWLVSLPLYHIGGLALLFRSLIGGGCLLFAEPHLSLTAQIEQNGITHISLVNTQLRRLLESGLNQKAIKELKAVIVGGGPQNENLLVSARSSGIPIATTYGMTETGSMITCSTPDRNAQATTHSGALLEHRELTLNHESEIMVRGECLMTGYINEDKILPAVDNNGWFHTGDLGELDREQNLKVIGRKDSMFISGGENIYPEQIEAALRTLPDITEVIVVPISDKQFGFRPVAFVRCDPVPSTLDSLAKKLRDLLPDFMIPICFLPWPRTLEQSGLKTSRSRLQKLAEQACHWAD